MNPHASVTPEEPCLPPVRASTPLPWEALHREAAAADEDPLLEAEGRCLDGENGAVGCPEPDPRGRSRARRLGLLAPALGKPGRNGFTVPPTGMCQKPTLLLLDGRSHPRAPSPPRPPACLKIPPCRCRFPAHLRFCRERPL